MLKTGLIRKHSLKLEILCKLIDAIFIAGCFYVSALVQDFPWNPHFSFISIVSVVLFFQFAKKNNLYLSWRTSSVWEESKEIIKSWFFTFLISITLALLIDLTGEYVRRVLISWFNWDNCPPFVAHRLAYLAALFSQEGKESENDSNSGGWCFRG